MNEKNLMRETKPAQVPRLMRAAVLSEPGPVENLVVQDVPILSPQEGWVRVAVRAFGLNRSELHTRLGLGEGVSFPRILGIEAVGVVDLDPSGTYRQGQQVATMMGEMGRQYDGGYAEYTCVPLGQLIPFHSELPWDQIGAVPETLQTAYGTLRIGVDLHDGNHLLVRGGTSALGLAITALAKRQGCTVYATTRRPERLEQLAACGVDVPLVDDGSIADQMRALRPEGVDGAVELVGTPTLRDTLRAVRIHGTACFTGMLSNAWTIDGFYPIDYIPYGVRLTSYAGEAADLPAAVLQDILDGIATGTVTLGPYHTYRLDEIQQAHRDMEEGTRVGKLVGMP